MAIVETKTVIRPTTSIPFFVDTNNATLVQLKSTIGYLFVEQTASFVKAATADNSVISERTVSADGLTQTNVVTFASIADYNRVETAISIKLDSEYQQYVEANGLSHSENQYVQAGFAAPFSCTTTYHYDADTATKYPLFDSFVAVIESSDKLESLINNGSSVVAVHHYLNSEDFNQTHWQDFVFCDKLNDGGVTRTITYALL